MAPDELKYDFQAHTKKPHPDPVEQFVRFSIEKPSSLSR